MSNEDIIDVLGITAKLMELHDENSFKTKAYANAAYKLSKLRYDFQGKTKEEIESIEGIGKGISTKIFDLINVGSIPEFEDLVARTPPGVIAMLGIKGLGPKKVRQLWLELQLESVGELLYACNENRLTTLKGFGEKTQMQVKQAIAFKTSNEKKFHYAAIEKPVIELIEHIRNSNIGIQIAAVGQIARKCEVIDKIELLTDLSDNLDLRAYDHHLPLLVDYIFCAPSEFVYKFVELTSTTEHLDKINFLSLEKKDFETETQVYNTLGLQLIEPELREGLSEVALAKENRIPSLITLSDLKGVLHNHTTYSDGVHTLEEMADYCKSLGYEYLGICDHSKSAFYAQGLSIEKVIQQQLEIDRLNTTFSGFKILKGIESDILNDGSLDYPDEILKTFDFIVASVHSNLKMDELKATTRLTKAIENPYTSILGHPTGRLLLSRMGYPIDHKKIIDACAANNVSIELNAHPYRLDIDWRWIPYCIEKGVMISINPDAHHKEGFHDMYYGVCAGRKGMLDKNNCLNALGFNDLIKKVKKDIFD